jgi:hypothetical protein
MTRFQTEIAKAREDVLVINNPFERNCDGFSDDILIIHTFVLIEHD